MSVVAATVRRAFAERLIYPANVFYDVGGAVMFLVVQAAIWRALYSGREILNDITLQHIITYIVVARLAVELAGEGPAGANPSVAP